MILLSDFGTSRQITLPTLKMHSNRLQRIIIQLYYPSISTADRMVSTQLRVNVCKERLTDRI